MTRPLRNNLKPGAALRAAARAMAGARLFQSRHGDRRGGHLLGARKLFLASRGFRRLKSCTRDAAGLSFEIHTTVCNFSRAQKRTDKRMVSTAWKDPPA